MKSASLAFIIQKQADLILSIGSNILSFVQLGGGQIQVLQPYLSFIPYAESPELKEMEQEFAGDMKKYIDEGDTARPIREYIEEFTKVAASLNFSAQ
jgi:hypothetical protein